MKDDADFDLINMALSLVNGRIVEGSWLLVDVDLLELLVSTTLFVFEASFIRHDEEQKLSLT